MLDRAADLNLQLANVPWWATILIEGSNSQDPRFKQTLCLHLDCMAETLNIDKGNDAGSHAEASLAFSVIFGQCSLARNGVFRVGAPLIAFEMS